MTSPIETNNVVERLRADADFLDTVLGAHPSRAARVRQAASDLQSLSDRIDELEGAGNALVVKLNECEPHIANAFAMEHFRGRPYSGPQYKDELDALRASLTQGGKTNG